MSGLRLTEMDAEDMLDVLHFFFESETAFVSPEQASEMTRIRKRLYEGLYERKYKYGQAVTDTEFKSKVQGQASDGSFDEYPYDDEDVSDLQPFDPARPPMTHKPFVPATDFNPESDDPFDGLLDGPATH